MIDAMVDLGAPKAANTAGKRAFREAIAVLTRIGEDPDANAQPLRRYALVISEMDALERSWAAGGRQATTTGSTGQPVRHPVLAVIADLRRQAGELERVLGLTVEARVAMNRRRGGLGMGHAPDRRDTQYTPPQRWPDGRVRLVTVKEDRA